MAFTYSDPSSSDLEAVRFLVGDTDSTDAQLQDAEIAYLLTSEGAVIPAAIAAAQAISAKYARLVDKSVGDLKVSYSQRKAQYSALIERLQRRLTLRSATPYAGGISESDKDTDRDDDDLAGPSFYRGQFDEPGTDTSYGDVDDDAVS